MNDLWQYEKEALAAGHTNICGCDEAGAGPLAGPVYAAAVILPLGVEIDGLNDSKKLTEKKREALFPVIQEKAAAWAVAWVDAREIDETDILSARMKAMQLAIDQLEPGADFALIDGTLIMVPWSLYFFSTKWVAVLNTDSIGANLSDTNCATWRMVFPSINTVKSKDPLIRYTAFTSLYW